MTKSHDAYLVATGCQAVVEFLVTDFCYLQMAGILMTPHEIMEQNNHREIIGRISQKESTVITKSKSMASSFAASTKANFSRCSKAEAPSSWSPSKLSYLGTKAPVEPCTGSGLMWWPWASGLALHDGEHDRGRHQRCNQRHDAGSCRSLACSWTQSPPPPIAFAGRTPNAPSARLAPALLPR